MSDSVSGRKKLDVESGQSSLHETASGSSDVYVYKTPAEGSEICKGSRKSSVKKGSDEVFEYSCDPCSSAGEHSEAEGFCTDCGEYLCGICFRSHSRSKASMNHRLLNKYDMQRKSAKACDPCKTADEEIDAVGYCRECEEYLCNDCFKRHSGNKATNHHHLIEKDKNPVESERVVASSIAKTDIQKGGSGNQSSDEKYTYVRKIKVKTSWREKKCYVVAMTLVSNTELVLADSSNESLKLVDTERYVTKDTLRLKIKPSGLTTIPEGKVAVALYSIYVIQIITVAGKLSVHGNIKISGLCLDIQFLNGKLYASLHKPVRFQILQPSGQVCKTVNPDSEVRKHCTTPCCIAVSPDVRVIYVSDWKSKNILSMDMDGKMMAIYKGELDMPNYIAISPFGSIYLCDAEHDVVYKMTSDLKEAFVILGPEELGSPLSICFSAANYHLYVSDRTDEAKERNYIKVFKWQ